LIDENSGETIDVSGYLQGGFGGYLADGVARVAILYLNDHVVGRPVDRDID
jgi:hypothetical protein